ncbi:MAG: 16S rRNA (guanine(527)-N(7))-methyltransferase RsmG [Solirubrobacterales bacterium]|nr:16S rRNA (guanine(527)-N(7))-methyltransferase RsmG [Solirubrobacterales bacterium]
MAPSGGERADVQRGLAELASRYELTDRQTGQLRRLLDGVEADPRAPTTVREARAALDVHVADSLVALQLDFVREAQSIADLGAGAGFPGIVLAIVLPDSVVSLLESQARKCVFMEAIVAATGVENAHVVNARAEDWQEGIGAHELITARAVGPQEVVLEYAAPLLAPSGRFVDWRGRRDHEAEAVAMAAAQELGLRRLEVRPVEPFAGARELHLHLFEKIAETPARFPRRTGLARKRPLGL